MSDDTDAGTDRRSLLKLAGLAGIPLLASTNASAATGDHLGETWSGTEGLTLDLTGDNKALNAKTEEGMGLVGQATADVSTSFGVYGYSGSTNGTGVYGEAGPTSGDTHGVRGESYSPDGYGVYGSANGFGGYGVYSDGDLHVEGNFTASGTKNFVQTVETPEGPKNVAYTAVEADKAQTETTGVAELKDGRAEIDLPEHFGLVTSDEEDLVVQLTAYDIDAPRLAVTERSTDRITIESMDGTGNAEFSYTVRGVREGYEDTEIVRDAE